MLRNTSVLIQSTLPTPPMLSTNVSLEANLLPHMDRWIEAACAVVAYATIMQNSNMAPRGVAHSAKAIDASMYAKGERLENATIVARLKKLEENEAVASKLMKALVRNME